MPGSPDGWMVFLRIVHIVSGAFWVGGAIFMEFIVIPRLRTLGPSVQAPVLRALTPIVGPAFSLSAVLLIASGTAMALWLRWGVLETFFAFGWGYAITIGFIVAMIGLAIGGMVVRPALRDIGALGASIQSAGRPPTLEEGARMAKLQKRASWANRTVVTLLVIGVGAMASIGGLDGSPA